MEIMTTTAVYPNKTMDLPGGHGYKDEFKRSIKIVSLVIYSLVFVLGMLGNGVVIWMTGFKMKKTVNTVLYLNLAVADFIFAAFLPLRITKTAMDSHWPFGQFVCKLTSTVLFLNMFASIYILMLISVDRCVCVVWPVWAQNQRTVRKASFVTLAVWVLGLAFSSPSYIFRDTRPDKNISMCFNNYALADDSSTPAAIQLFNFRLKAMIITRFLLVFVVPFTVIVFCYSVIIHRLRKSRLLISHSGRTFKIIAAVITAFFLCWAPYHIIEQIRLVNLMAAEYSKTLHRVFKMGFPIARCLAFLNSCLNPLLYVFMGQNFKDVFRRSILKVLENVFTEELPQTNISTYSGITSQETALSETQV